MKNQIFAFLVCTLLLSQTSFAKVFKCEGAYDAGGIGFSFSTEGDLEIGQKLSMALQGYNFSMNRFDDEKGVKFITAMVESPEGDETTALYSIETPVVQMLVKKGPSTTYKFSCLAK